MSTEAQKYVDGLPSGDSPGEVPRNARAILRTIASFMQEHPTDASIHRVCFVKQTKLAAVIGKSERTIRNAVGALSLAGVIICVRRHPSMAGKSGCVYEIRIVGFSDQQEIVAARSGNSRGTNRQTMHDQPADFDRPTGKNPSPYKEDTIRTLPHPREEQVSFGANPVVGRGIGWHGAWTSAGKAAVEEMRNSTVDAVADVAEVFIDAVRAQLPPYRAHCGPDQEKYIREMGKRLCQFDRPTLNALAEYQLINRTDCLDSIPRLATIACNLPKPLAGTPAVSGVFITEKSHPNEVKAWIDYTRARGKPSINPEVQHLYGIRKILENHGTCCVPTLWPPAK